MQRAVRVLALALLAFSACRTTTQAGARTASASFERELAGDARITQSAEAGVEALVFDFPRKKLIGLGGKVSSWLGWLDARSPRGAIESVQNLSADGAAVSVSLHGGPPLACSLDPSLETSTFPFEALSPEGLAELDKAFGGMPHRSRATGLSITIGQTELKGPVVDVGAKECRIGVDFLGQLVVLLPNHGHQPLLILVPKE